jgi:DNA-directed RNA polymerase subunit omega
MARITIEDCLEKIESRFALVRMTQERVLQLKNGSKPLVDCENKEIVTTLREIAVGKLKFRESNTTNEDQINNTKPCDSKSKKKR